MVEYWAKWLHEEKDKIKDMVAYHVHTIGKGASYQCMKRKLKIGNHVRVNVEHINAW